MPATLPPPAPSALRVHAPKARRVQRLVSGDVLPGFTLNMAERWDALK